MLSRDGVCLCSLEYAGDRSATNGAAFVSALTRTDGSLVAEGNHRVDPGGAASGE